MTTLVALLATVPVLLATRGELGISADSTQYLATTRNLIAGRGLLTMWWAGHPEPLTHFPPLYPYLLSLISKIVMDPLRSALVLQILLIVTNVLLTAVLASRIAGGSLAQRARAALAAAIAVAMATDFATAHAMMWTEPLFLALLMSTLLVLSRYLELARGRGLGYRLDLLTIAALLAGAGTLTRYVGIVLIGVGLLAICLSHSERIAVRIRRSLYFATLSLGPVAVAALFNVAHGRSASNRELALHIISSKDLRAGFATIVSWVAPYAPWRGLRLMELGVAAVAFAVVLAVSLARNVAAPFGRTARRHSERKHAADGASTALARLCVLFLVCYPVFLVVSVSLADRSTDLDSRMLLPALPLAIALSVALVSVTLRIGGHARRQRARAWVAVSGLAISYLLAQSISLTLWIRGARQHGLGLRSLERSSPALLKRIGELPQGAIIYSNLPFAINFLTDRVATGVPLRFSPTSLRTNPHFDSQIAAIVPASADSVFLVLFDAGRDVSYLATIHDLQRRLSIRRVEAFIGGQIDVVAGGR